MRIGCGQKKALKNLVRGRDSLLYFLVWGFIQKSPFLQGLEAIFFKTAVQEL